jgi:hypothetical protein
MNPEVKKEIASAVQRAVLGYNFHNLGNTWANLGIADVEVSRVDNLNMQIRVRTQREGVRYFTVKVSEPI